jgi:ribonuclease P protein component
MSKYEFPKSAKLTSRSDFRAIIEYKLCVKNDLIVLYMTPNRIGKSRFAVSVSSKVAPAVVRNRLKRLAREAFRLGRGEIADGFDYLVIYSTMLSKKSCSDIRKITLNEVKQGFLELAEQCRRRFERRRDKS